MSNLETNLEKVNAAVNDKRRKHRHRDIKAEFRAFSIWARQNLVEKPEPKRGVMAFSLPMWVKGIFG